MIIAIVVDSIVTGEDDNLLYDKKSTLYINQEKGTIDYIIEGNPTSIDYDKLITFPQYTTILPGFIDCHVHLTIAKDDYQIDHLKLSSADKSLRALKAAQGLQNAGFTTLRTAGDADNYFPTFAVAKSIKNQDFDGPRIVGAGILHIINNF
jgi:imidazolonepropionase-like amidohydrolase